MKMTYLINLLCFALFLVGAFAIEDECKSPLPPPCENPKAVESLLRGAVEKYAGGKAKGSMMAPKVHVYCDEKKGRGLQFTGKRMNKSEIFFRIPVSAIYTAQSYMYDKIKPVNHLDALTLVVLEQSVLANSYVETLPLSIGLPTGFRMCDSELKERIKDEALREQARDMRQTVRDRAEELRSMGYIKDRSRYEKALSVVQSRVFVVRALKDGKWVRVPSLVMVADILNLALGKKANTDCMTNEASTHFECFATRDIEKGEELLAPFEKTASYDMSSYTWFNYGFEFSKEELDEYEKESTKSEL